MDWLQKNAGGRRKAISALIYTVVVLGLAGYALATAGRVLSARADVDALRERLAALKAHERGGAGPAANAADGSPLLREATITLAGAALQQRVEQAVARAGGALQSDEVALDGPGEKDGLIRVTANLELAQSGLQPLLYDLEAGMPYLFVEALDVQSPQALGEADNGPMRIALTVSSRWEPGL
jgi:general secretion pathway protein M